ncbi:unnamed protein product [Symbiodinium necroappetens]|uniref:Uncharacterized protein n=1 Tax=Symbiodinium necroappetens TaxID=1628268 RepID=A0A812W3R3_9DINO|nr:unnamed protein product [Symbiodinium necroappetens]
MTVGELVDSAFIGYELTDETSRLHQEIMAQAADCIAPQCEKSFECSVARPHLPVYATEPDLEPTADEDHLTRDDDDNRAVDGDALPGEVVFRYADDAVYFGPPGSTSRVVTVCDYEDLVQTIRRNNPHMYSAHATPPASNFSRDARDARWVGASPPA